MTAHDLSIIQRAFQECLRDIAVLERFDHDGHFFEVNDVQKENRRWLVIAAGVDQADAEELFAGNPKRAEKSLTPLRYRSTCRISLLFVLRSFDKEPMYSNQTLLVSPFAPTRGSPWVEIRKGYIRVFDIPENKNRLLNLRWEWEVVEALQNPLEKWLCSWTGDCGFNPGHPPSHLHLNSEVFERDGDVIRRPGDLVDELRLAVGRPNPLAFLLSLAVWLRKL